MNTSQFTFHLNKNHKISIVDEINNCYQNEFFKTLEYDDKSFIFSTSIVTTDELSFSDESVGNAFINISEECFNIEADKLQINF